MADMIFDGPVPNDQLTWYVRELPKPANLALERVFPARNIDTPRIRLDATVTRRNRTAAFRTPDGHFRELGRDGAEIRELAFMQLGAKANESEYEYMEQLYATMQGGNMQLLKNALYRDVEMLQESVYNRLELARGDEMRDGILSVNEEGVVKDLDFQVPDDHFMTADVMWDSGQAHSKLLQLETAKRKYREVNGFNPAGFICSEDLWSMILRDDEFKPYFTGAFGTPNLVTETQAQGVMRDLGLPMMLWSYDTRLMVLNETTGVEEEVDVLDPNTLYFLPPGEAIGYTAWGITTTARELINAPKTDFGWTDAHGLAGVVVKNQAPPYTKTTYVDAVATPVIDKPKQLMTLKVRNG